MVDHINPFYQRLSLNLITITLLGTLLYIGQGIIIPLCFSILLASLLLPVVRFLQHRFRLPSLLAIIVALLLSLLTILGIFYMLSLQISTFLEDFDVIKERLVGLVSQLQDWVNSTFHVGAKLQRQYLSETAEKIKELGPGMLGKTVGTITEMFAYILFLPIYTFLILYYRRLIKGFIVAVFRQGHENKVSDVLSQSQAISQSFVVGLLIEMSIVFTLNSIGFLFLGIKYAIFLALVAALLNLVPYIGMLIANLFCMLITLVSSPDISDVVWVAAILGVVQFIDNNFLVPLIVGNKVRINALVTMLGVVLGGTLTGVSGMFLAIPALAVMKVIFDNTESLKPWGMLLGDEVESDADKEST
jgi:predicted PurR-regulated permease PerM